MYSCEFRAVKNMDEISFIQVKLRANDDDSVAEI